MPRKPKVRVSYNDDAQFLLRLKDAVMRDHARPLEWRQGIADMANKLAIAMLTAPSSSPGAESERPRPPATRRNRRAS